MQTFPTPPTRRAARRALLAAAAVAGLLTAGAVLGAEECPPFRPTPEHALLAAWEGTWNLTFSDGSQGTSSCRVGLGGQWLQEQVEIAFSGHPYAGSGATSYDPVRKRYVNVWIDSVSPRPLVSEGTYDPATRTLTLVGDMTSPAGKTVKATILITQAEEGSRTFAMRVAGPDGNPQELFRIDYRRRAD